MTLEQSHENHEERIEKKSLKEMISLGENFNVVSNELSMREDNQRKRIGFGWNTYQDTSDIIHIPFDKEHRITSQYGMKFKDIDVGLMGVIKPHPAKNGTLTFKLFQHSMNGKLSDENLLLNSSISNSWGSLENKVSIELAKWWLSVKESSIIITRAKSYLSTYFGYEQERKIEERIDEIQFQELTSKEEEWDPEELLEQMDWSVGI